MRISLIDVVVKAALAELYTFIPLVNLYLEGNLMSIIQVPLLFLPGWRRGPEI